VVSATVSMIAIMELKLERLREQGIEMPPVSV
jgi:hypothetical protein